MADEKPKIRERVDDGSGHKTKSDVIILRNTTNRTIEIEIDLVNRSNFSGVECVVIHPHENVRVLGILLDQINVKSLIATGSLKKI